MSPSSRHNVWIGLATDLLDRDDIRPDIRQEVERALQHSDPAAVADSVRHALAGAITKHQREEERLLEQARTSKERQLKLARQALSLIDHGIRRVQESPEHLATGLVRFLKSALLDYVGAYDLAGRPDGLESSEQVVARVLDQLSRRTVLGRPARVGVLHANEIAGVATGAVPLTATATVVSTGSLQRDLEKWHGSSEIPEDRRRQLQNGDFGDGEYVLTVIQPTAAGEQITVHPISAGGRPTPEPIARFTGPKQAEPIPVVNVIVAPAVTEPLPQVRQPVQIGDYRRALPQIDDLRQTAVALNQSRIGLYAEILRTRSDLRGAARQAAERRLERMELESAALADDDAPIGTIHHYLSQWSKELGRDLTALSAKIGLPSVEGTFTRRLGALSRMGALQSRFDSLKAGAEGVVYRSGVFSGLSDEARVLLQPESSSRSIFDSFSGPRVSSGAQRAEARSVAGEKLSSQVMMRDAERATAPARKTQRYLREVARAGRRLGQALTTASVMSQSGLGLSSRLSPLLRPAGMPSVIRADTRSPLLRHLLLPAMEQVSGPNRALARRASGASAQSQTPEQLFGALLGERGMELIEKRPELAKNLLGQMGDLAQRLSRAGEAPSMGALRRAGMEMRERLSTVSAIEDDDAGGAPQPTEGEVAADVVGAAVGVPPEGSVPSIEEASSMAETAVSDVAGELAQEGAPLASALKERIEPFVQVGADTKVYSGAIASRALDEMGAMGASIGRDIYVHQRMMQLGGADTAAVIGHEAVHAQRSRLGGGSVESEEEEAYKVEAKIRDSFQLGELAREQAPDLPGKGEDDPTAESEKDAKTDVMINDLADAVSNLWEDEAVLSTLTPGRWRY